MIKMIFIRVKLKEGKMGSHIDTRERETLKYYKVEMILIYHFALYIIIGVETCMLSRHQERKVEKSRKVLKGDR